MTVMTSALVGMLVASLALGPDAAVTPTASADGGSGEEGAMTGEGSAAPEPVEPVEPVDGDATSDADPEFGGVSPDAEPSDSSLARSGAAAGSESVAPVDPGPAEPPPPEGSEPAARDADFESGVAIGGYYGHGEILERTPPDGREQIVVGSILVPLGTLAAITSGAGLWLTVPEHCVERLARIGTTVSDPSKCTAPFTFNAIRTTYGVLMLASGATILALGMIKRERYRKWKAQHGMRAQVDPVLYPSRRLVGGGLRIRF